MRLLTKLRAILTLGIVSGIFWWLAFLIGRSGYELIVFGRFGFGNPMGWVFGLLGFVGGTLYATGVALLPQREGREGLSTGQAALLGALGGAVVLAVLRFGIIGHVISGGIVGSVIFPMAVCSLLGAGTALAISGTAKRGALPLAPSDRRRLAE